LGNAKEALTLFSALKKSGSIEAARMGKPAWSFYSFTFSALKKSGSIEAAGR